MRILGRLVRLSWADRRIAAAALLVLPVTALAVRAAGFARSQRFLARMSPIVPGDVDSGGLLRARRIARLVHAVAGQWPYRFTCLPQSMTLWWLMQRQRIPSQLHIGVRKVVGGERLEAHAWVECGGEPLDPQPDVRHEFSAFPEPVGVGRHG